MKEGERLEVKGDRLPDDWKWMKLKYLVTENLQYGANESGIEYSSLLPRYIRITDIDSNGKLKNEEMLSLSEEKSENYLLEEGDILFARSGASVGKTFIYKSKYGRASFAGYLIRAKLDKKIINPQFFFYYTLSSEYDIWKNGIFIQSTIQNIGADKYSDLLVPVPPLTSQLSLITFLDKKCSEIDSVISKTRETIEEYKKLKQSIITEVVTGKVKIENGKVKESEMSDVKGNKLPNDWKWMKLKYLVTENLQYGANEAGVDFSSDLPRYIRITDIDSNGKLKNENKLSLTEEVARNFILDEGDILFARSGASVGKTFIYKSEYARAGFAGYLIRAKLNKSIINPQFFFYFTNSSFYEIWKNGIFIQSTIQNIGADKYSELQVPVPPLTSQLSLITFLDKKCSEIDNLITKKEQLVVELEAYKKSLIYEVVTGKRSVI